MRDRTFNQYSTHVVQLAAAEHRPLKDLRALLMVKADELALPLTQDQIDIAGVGRTLRVDVRYEDDIKIPVLGRRLYRVKFAHNFSSGSF